jgi:hypothetical protein
VPEEWAGLRARQQETARDSKRQDAALKDGVAYAQDMPHVGATRAIDST